MVQQIEQEWPMLGYRADWLRASHADEERFKLLREVRNAKSRVLLQALLAKTLGIEIDLPRKSTVEIDGVTFRAWPIMPESGIGEVWKLAIVDYCGDCGQDFQTIVDSPAAVGRHLRTAKTPDHACQWQS